MGNIIYPLDIFTMDSHIGTGPPGPKARDAAGIDTGPAIPNAAMEGL